MKHLVIIYHSQSGSTAILANAVYRGAIPEENIDVRLLRAMEASTDDLLWADAVIFGTPENFGYMSGGLKDFFDRTFYPCEPYKLNLPFTSFISAGNDGVGAIRQIEKIVKAYPFRCVLEPIILKGTVDEKKQQECETLGAAMAAGLSMGIF